jgi:hypothetical protein
VQAVDRLKPFRFPYSFQVRWNFVLEKQSAFMVVHLRLRLWFAAMRVDWQVFFLAFRLGLFLCRLARLTLGVSSSIEGSSGKTNFALC